MTDRNCNYKRTLDCATYSTHNVENHKEFNQRLTKVATAVKCSIVALGFGVSATSNAATIEVTSHLDDGTRCTLREAVISVSNGAAVNGCLPSGSFANDNTITFASTLTSNTITLANGQLNFTDETVPLSIDASNISGGITIDAGSNSRVLYTQSATLTLDNLTITGGSYFNVGGGIYAGDGTTLSINNTTISGNTAQGSGGGIYLVTANLSATSSTVENSISGARGGGIYAKDSQVTLIDTTISSNQANSGGGLSASDTDLIIANSTIDSNIAMPLSSPDGRGGGIELIDSSTLNIVNTLVTNNSARYGGGIHLYESTSLTANNIQISNNSTVYYGGGIRSYAATTISNSSIINNTAGYAGGGIQNYGTTTISNSSIINNTAGYYGGGIQNDGTTTISNSSIINNTAGYYGGGIINYGTTTISNSTLSNNMALQGRGGGIQHNVGALLTISNSSVSANSSGRAGGLNSYGTTLITNSTFSGNSASIIGGGILSEGATTIINSIVSGNIADSGYSEIFQSNDETTTQNTLIGHSGLTTEMAVGSRITPSDTDIIATSDGSNIPLAQILSPLAQNGGNTQTHALPAGSPAIDAANRSNCPTTDQRGETRGFLCDIGAYEFNTNDQDTSFYVIPLPDGKAVVIPL